MTFTRWMIYILWHRIPCQVHAVIVPDAALALVFGVHKKGISFIFSKEISMVKSQHPNA